MTTINITHTGLELVSGKYFAYADNCQFEITHKVHMDWSFKLQSGYSIEIEQDAFDDMDCEKYTY